MRKNHIKIQLRKGEPSFGAWLTLPSPAVARLLARQGFDWLVIDTEHGAQHPSLMAQMIESVSMVPTCAPLVRVPTLSVEWFKWAFDAGAWGVIVPMINTAAEARQAVQWSKYPPEGTRSLGGLFTPYTLGANSWSDYMASANDELMTIVQIESRQALDNLDEILQVDGLDAAFVGPNDLHAQLGLPPGNESTEPAFLSALEQIRASGARHQVPLGIYCSNGRAAAARIREGFQMVSVMLDAMGLNTAATENLLRARA